MRWTMRGREGGCRQGAALLGRPLALPARRSRTGWIPPRPSAWEKVLQAGCMESSRGMFRLRSMLMGPSRGGLRGLDVSVADHRSSARDSRVSRRAWQPMCFVRRMDVPTGRPRRGVGAPTVKDAGRGNGPGVVGSANAGRGASRPQRRARPLRGLCSLWRSKRCRVMEADEGVLATKNAKSAQQEGLQVGAELRLAMDRGGPSTSPQNAEREIQPVV